MNRHIICLLLISLCLSLAACDTESNYAPVAEINTIEPIPKTGVYHATRNETLYEIAWRYGLDYRDLAMRNQIKSPYRIRQGQTIYLREGTPATIAKINHPKIAPQIAQEQSWQVATKPVVKINPITAEPVVKIKPKPINTVREIPKVLDTSNSDLPVSSWIWPARGKVVRQFSSLNKGINIGGREGEPIYATATGKVVYCGDGLRGYGNLIILKHNNLYLSAYAHNETLLVKEGDVVKQGQKIAEMGDTGANKTMLHFEIRRAGKPIDPTSLLNS